MRDGQLRELLLDEPALMGAYVTATPAETITPR
jgi:hypothetical protein